MQSATSASCASLRRELGAERHAAPRCQSGLRPCAVRESRIVARLADAGVDIVEQPAVGLAYHGGGHGGATVPIIADESCWDVNDALEVVRHRAADCFRCILPRRADSSAHGRVAAVAEAQLIACDMNGSIESAIGNAANTHFALAHAAVTLASVIPISAPAGAHPYAVAGRYYEDDVSASRSPFATARSCRSMARASASRSMRRGWLAIGVTDECAAIAHRRGCRWHLHGHRLHLCGRASCPRARFPLRRTTTHKRSSLASNAHCRSRSDAVDATVLHASTVATNAIMEGKGALTALVTTARFSGRAGAAPHPCAAPLRPVIREATAARAASSSSRNHGTPRCARRGRYAAR